MSKRTTSSMRQEITAQLPLLCISWFSCFLYSPFFFLLVSIGTWRATASVPDFVFPLRVLLEEKTISVSQSLKHLVSSASSRPVSLECNGSFPAAPPPPPPPPPPPDMQEALQKKRKRKEKSRRPWQRSVRYQLFSRQDSVLVSGRPRLQQKRGPDRRVLTGPCLPLSCSRNRPSPTLKTTKVLWAGSTSLPPPPPPPSLPSGESTQSGLDLPRRCSTSPVCRSRS